jgi:hypothetical protein
MVENSICNRAIAPTSTGTEHVERDGSDLPPVGQYENPTSQSLRRGQLYGVGQTHDQGAPKRSVGGLGAPETFPPLLVSRAGFEPRSAD